MTGPKNPAALTEDDPGQIGPHQVIGRLGEGGTGTVYAALHPHTGERLAVKTLRRDFASDRVYRARFQREVGTLRAVTGPYVVPLIDADPTADRPWLATASQSFTFATDQEPDYDGSRKHSHRAWWLPDSHYLVYTVGNPTAEQEPAVRSVVESMSFSGPQQIPKDCADAVKGLDVAVAHTTDAPHPETFQSCIDQTSAWTAEQNHTSGQPGTTPNAVDPGTVSTGTEAACAALVTHYMDGGLMSDDSPDTYDRLRPLCDIPRG